MHGLRSTPSGLVKKDSREAVGDAGTETLCFEVTLGEAEGPGVPGEELRKMSSG